MAFLLTKSRIQGDKPPFKVKLKCEAKFPEVGNNQKNKVKNSVDFVAVCDMKVMFERKLKEEDNTVKIRRLQSTSGRQPKQCGTAEDNIGNYVEAPDQLLEKSSKVKCKAKRLASNLPKQLLSQERGNLCESNGTQE